MVSLFETHLKPGLSVLETVVGVGSTFYMLVTMVKFGVWSLCLRLSLKLDWVLETVVGVCGVALTLAAAGQVSCPPYVRDHGQCWGVPGVLLITLLNCIHTEMSTGFAFHLVSSRNVCPPR